jgi:hypothetical protein
MWQKEYLAAQLNFEFGNISEDEYNKQEDKYLVEAEDIPVQELKQYIEVLFMLSHVVMDSEEISEAFNCPVDTAENALRAFTSAGKSDSGIELPV